MISRLSTRIRIRPLIKKSTQFNALRFQTSGPGPMSGGVSTKEKSNMIYYGVGGAIIGSLVYKMYRDQSESSSPRPKLESNKHVN